MSDAFMSLLEASIWSCAHLGLARVGKDIDSFDYLKQQHGQENSDTSLLHILMSSVEDPTCGVTCGWKLHLAFEKQVVTLIVTNELLIKNDSTTLKAKHKKPTQT